MSLDYRMVSLMIFKLYIIEQVMDFLGKTKKEYKDNYTGHLKPSSLERTYYKTKNMFSGISFTIEEEDIPEYPPDELLPLRYMKQLEYNDMKRLKKNITRTFLHKYGFYEYEINQLIQNGEPIEDV